MAELTLWNLDNTGSSSVLQRTTGERHGRVAYTRHADIVGELDVAADAVTEYALPASLHVAPAGMAATPSGVAQAAPGVTWCALANGHSLVRVDGSGTLRAWPLVEAGTPFAHPWHVNVPDAASGVAWFAGASPGSPSMPVIGRVDPAGGLASYWKLSGLKHYFPTDLWIQPDPLSAWITFKRSRSLATPCVLARLDAATGVLTTWHAAYTSAQTALPMGSFGVMGSSGCNGRRVWSSFYDPACAGSGSNAPESAVHMFDLDSGVFTEFATGPDFLPGCVAVGADGQPWFGTLDNVRLGTPTCTRVITRQARQAIVAPRTLVLQERAAAGAASRIAVPPVVTTLARQVAPCLADYAAAALTNTWVASLGTGTPAPAAPMAVYFAAPSTVAGRSGHIGRLAV